MVALTRRWGTSQPPANAPVDWGNPLAQELTCLVPALARQDIVGRLPITGTGTLRGSIRGVGIGSAGTAGGSGLTVGDTSSPVAPFENATIVMVGTAYLRSGSASGILTTDSTTGSATGAISQSATADNRFAVVGSTFNTLSIRPAGFSITWSGAPGSYDRRSCVLDASGQVALAGTTNFAGTYGFRNIQVGAGTGFEAFYLLAAWRRTLTDAEIGSIVADPWQLFQPRKIWVPYSAGSGATVHNASGALVGGGATLTGVAARSRIHDASGVLAGGGAAVVGAADRASPGGAHVATGALVGGGAVVSGAATLAKTHAASGALVGGGAVIAGEAAHLRTHAGSGALEGAGAVVAGSAARSGAVVPTLTIRLLDKAEAGSPIASASGWDCFWYDDATTMAEALATTPTTTLLAQSTDSLGQLVLTLTGSVKASGEYGFLMFSNGDGTTTQSPPPRSFAALVPVD